MTNNVSPLISVFTPTNDARWLGKAYEQMRRQTFSDWEWIILPNGGAQIPPFDDSRVRVITDAAMLPKSNIGYLKRICCEHCRGDFIVELDHDDFLHHQCLEKLVFAFQEHNADFVYSGFAEFEDETNNPRRTYNPDWGWRYTEYEYDEIKYTCPVSHPPVPPFILRITHGPNHVRSWRASAYRELGGHRVDLEVGDDYDLFCKFYAAGKKFHHIPDCLYFYRWRTDGANNTNTKNRNIQDNVEMLYDDYIIPMMMRCCRDRKLLAIDLGAAHGKPQGFLGVDRLKAPGVDVVADLNERWPFEDSSVGLIRAYDFIEHLPDKIHTMNEIWRVLAPEGVVVIEVPSTDGRGAFQDPFHISFWCENSFWYYTDDRYKAFAPEIKGAFWPLRFRTWFPNQWCKERNISYVQVHLVCLKKGLHLPQPFPHMAVPE